MTNDVHGPFGVLTLAQSDWLAAAPQWVLVATGIGGVVLWLFGHTSMKAGFGVLGIVIGGLIGFVAPAAFGASVHPGITAGIGAIAGLVIGVATFRVSIGLTLGLAMGVAAGLAAFASVAPEHAQRLRAAGPGVDELELSARVDGSGEPSGGPSDDAVKRVREWLESQGEGGADTEGTVAAGATMMGQGADRLRETGERIADRVRPVWNELPRENRTAIALACAGAGTVGMGLGLFFPKRSAAMVTAFAGALLWVPAVIELAGRSRLGGSWVNEASLGRQLMLVCGVAVIGTLIQWGVSMRRADKA